MDQDQIKSRCSRLKSLARSLAFLLEALEDVRDDAKGEGFGAAEFLVKEIEESIEQFESDLIREKGASND